jgi:hypothetical protein
MIDMGSKEKKRKGWDAGNKLHQSLEHFCQGLLSHLFFLPQHFKMIRERDRFS